MKKINNKGMAYLLIIILGGLLITGTGIYYASSITESRISNNSKLSKEVFYHAENAMNTITADLIKPNPNDILTETDINNLIKLNLNQTYPIPKSYTRNTTHGLLKSTLFIKFSKLLSENINLGENKTDSKLIEYTIYSNGFLEQLNRQLLARNLESKIRVLLIRSSEIPPKVLEGGTWREIEIFEDVLGQLPGIDYSISTGNNLYFSGDSKVTANPPPPASQTGKGVYSTKTLNLGNGKNKLRIDRGEAYTSAAKIEGEGRINPRDNQNPINTNQPILTFPEVNFNYFKNIADYTYGTTTFNSVQSNWSDIKPQPTVDGQIVIYVEGDLKITGNFVNTSKIILVVTGKVELNGNAQLGSPTVPFAILAGGDISRSTGSADMYGVYYTTGSLDLKGNFKFEGALMAKKNVSLNGNANIQYKQSLTTDANFTLGQIEKRWVRNETVFINETIIINGTPAGSWIIDEIEKIKGSWKENPKPFFP